MIDGGDSRGGPAPTRAVEVPAPVPTADAVRAFYRRVRARAASLLAISPAGGYRLFLGRDDLATVIAERRIARDGFAVVGRHPRCHLCLADDAGISLRHLFVRPAIATDGARTLRVLDLGASLAFRLLDERPRRALVTTGSLALRVGRYALLALPEGAPPPSELPDPVVVDAPAGSPAPDAAPVDASSPSRATPTLVTVTPRPSGLRRGHVVEDAAGILVASRGDREAHAVVGHRDLERGLLVGRLPRCVEGGMPENPRFRRQPRAPDAPSRGRADARVRFSRR